MSLLLGKLRGHLIGNGKNGEERKNGNILCISSSLPKRLEGKYD